MIFSMIGGWFTSTMALFFVGFLDTIAYTLLVTAYNIFYAVAHLDLFGGGTAGETLYNEITSRFYTILSIVMVFVFAYQLIMLIVDPEGKEQKSQSALIKDTIISLILVIIMPTIFRYMSLFQYHVLEDNSIGAIIMGTGNGDSDQNPGKKVALMVLISFYHPEGTTYDTFYDTDGLKDESTATSLCEEQTAAYSTSIGSDGDADVNTCKNYYDALNKWEGANDIAVGSITTNGKLHDVVGDQMEYMWILSTAGALVCAWFFFSYAIDLGTRAVKLGVLQLISPIPVILRIFPQTKKTFETWFGEIKKTYLELFIRVAIIFFILELIILIPTFIEILMQANDALTGIAKAISTVILILGMLKFAKDAPELFKTLFSNGGNLLSGLNFKPGMKKRVEDNTYAMKGIGAATGAIGGAASRFATQYKKNMENMNPEAGNNGKWGRRAASAFGALGALPRGVISGGRNGLRNSPTQLNGEGLSNTFNQGVVGSQNSYRNARFQGTRENLNNLVHELATGEHNKSTLEAVGDAFKGQGRVITARAEERYTDGKNSFTNFKDTLTGTSANFSAIQANATTITNGIDSMKKLSETAIKEKNDAKSKLEARLASAVDHTAEIAGKETMKTALETRISQLNNTKTSYEQQIATLENAIANGNLDIATKTKHQEKISELKLQIKDATSAITANENQIMQIDTDIKVLKDDPNSRENIKNEIKNTKEEIVAKQTEIYNQKIGERAQMAANIEKLIYSTGFSDSVMQELDAKVNEKCSQSLEELLKDFKNQNKTDLTVDQAKALHSISDIIKQAGTDASLIASLKQSQSSSGGDSKGDKK